MCSDSAAEEAPLAKSPQPFEHCSSAESTPSRSAGSSLTGSSGPSPPPPWTPLAAPATSRRRHSRRGWCSPHDPAVTTGPNDTPVPSGKERCANKAVIDLLVATSAHQVLAGAVLTTGSARAAAVSRRRLLLYGTSSLPPAKYGGCFAAQAATVNLVGIGCPAAREQALGTPVRRAARACALPVAGAAGASCESSPLSSGKRPT
jgi:hypothetical protein